MTSTHPGAGTAPTTPTSTPTSPDVPRGRTAPKRDTRTGKAHRAGRVAPWALLSPAMVLLLLMTVAPAIYLVWSSLRNDTLLGTGGQFVGLRNYQDALTNPAVLQSLLITAGFVLVAVTVEMVLGLLLAVPLAAQSRSNNLAAALMLLPFAVTPAVSAMMFKELLNPNYGWVDYYMGQLGLPAHVEWLSHSGTAWLALIGLDVWQWTPFVALILMAGMQS